MKKSVPQNSDQNDATLKAAIFDNRGSRQDYTDCHSLSLRDLEHAYRPKKQNPQAIQFELSNKGESPLNFKNDNSPSESERCKGIPGETDLIRNELRRLLSQTTCQVSSELSK